MDTYRKRTFVQSAIDDRGEIIPPEDYSFFNIQRLLGKDFLRLFW